MFCDKLRQSGTDDSQIIELDFEEAENERLHDWLLN